MSDALVADTAVTQAAGLGRAMNWINGEWVDSNKRSKSFDPRQVWRSALLQMPATRMSKLRSGRLYALSPRATGKTIVTFEPKVLNQVADRFEARRTEIEILAETAR